MQANKIRVIDFMDLLGPLRYINVIDGSYDNILLSYYTSIYHHKFEDIDESILSMEISEIICKHDDNLIIINVGERIE